MIEGEQTTLAAALERFAFRIIQEGLTNTLKHAGPPPSARLPAVSAVSLDVALVCSDSPVFVEREY